MSQETFEAAARLYGRAAGLFHGTALLDLALEHGCGTHSGDTAASWLLKQIEAGTVAANHPAPDHSQRAFASLGGMATKKWSVHEHYTALGWYYSWLEVVPLSERIALRTQLGLSYT